MPHASRRMKEPLREPIAAANGAEFRLHAVCRRLPGQEEYTPAKITSGCTRNLYVSAFLRDDVRR